MLAGVTTNDRYAHPDAGLPVTPLLNLVGQRLARGGRETNILSLWFGLIEIKKILVQADQQREALDRCRCRQIGPFGRGEDVHGPRM